ncbi:MAG: thioesterase family protein [Rhodospirillales bacterium]
MSDPQPIRLWEETVVQAWVDYNAHMNVAFYVLIFDHATDAFLEHIGMDEKHRLATASSVFVAEAHVTYDHEVLEGERVYITTQVLGHDAKRLHLFHRMYNARDDRLCATNELMILHVNLIERKVGPFPDAVLGRIADIGSEHAAIDKPAASGRAIAMRR